MASDLDFLIEELRKEDLNESKSLSLEDYSIIEQLSKGDDSETCHATINETGKDVVIKRIKIGNETTNLMAQREIDVHQKLNFRFVVKFITSFIDYDEDGFFIVMEYCPAGSLFDMIQQLIIHQQYCEENYAWDVLSQLVITINYLHSIRILHKDLKPENVFLAENKEIRLGDFGISKIIDPSVSVANTLKGTPEYIPPELLVEQSYRAISDVWGIGVILYELLARKKPFQGSSQDIIFQSIVNQNPPPLRADKYSQILRDVVNNMLIKDRTKRITVNKLIKVPEINKRVKQYAHEMIGTANEDMRTYLDNLLHDVDIQTISSIRLHPTACLEIIPIDPNTVTFEVKDSAISRLNKGKPGEYLIRLMKSKQNYTIGIAPEIVAGAGVVQIKIIFEDLVNQNRGCRWIGVASADLEIPETYFPGQDEASVGYCGTDASVIHLTEDMCIKYIEGNEPYGNNDIVTLEVNMHPNKEKRTLHFFVKDKQQPISFVGLPDRIKFIVLRQQYGTAVSIISMQAISLPTTVDKLPNSKIIDW
ncbi:MAG: putative kinase domain protein [Streblomastix strix]|uniref:non-specific serine/threonine protein kinase n=1 Tax=Streblomastix strix TaxID=222440 RepID=A0A5J4WP81_9EUKA|nr:MAG: putative kinase domain protein [Streblomastix strix]